MEANRLRVVNECIRLGMHGHEGAECITLFRVSSYVHSDMIVGCCSLSMVEAKLTILNHFLCC